MTDTPFTFIFSVCFGCWSWIKLAEACIETNWKRRAIDLFWAVAAALASFTLLARVQ